MLPERDELPADPERRELEAVAFGKAHSLADDSGKRSALADGIARAEHHAVLDPVAEKRTPVGAEEVLLVAAELEVRERVAPVGADEVDRGSSHPRIRKASRRGERPEDQVGDRDRGRDA